MMANWLKAIIFVSVTLLSTLIISILYPKVHPLGGVETGFEAHQVEQRAQEIAEQLGYSQSVSNLRPISDFNFNNPLLKQVHTEHGIENGNEIIKKELPVYYWEVHWDEDRMRNLQLGGGPPEEVKDKEHDALEKLVMKLDLEGNIIEVEASLSDSITAKNYSSEKAFKTVSNFINNFSPFTIDTVDGKKRKLRLIDERSNSSGSSEHQYRFEGNYLGLNQPIYATLIISRGLISEFKIDYNIPNEYTKSEIISIREIVTILLYIGIVALIIVYGYRRIKALEIGFKLSLFITVIVILSFSIELFTYYASGIDWKILIPLIFGNLFIGGGIFLLWAVSESIAREEWKGKFITLDLLNNGYILHSRVGLSSLTGLAGAFAVTAIWLLLLFASEQIGLIDYIKLDSEDLNFFTSISPGLSILNKSFYSSAYLFVIFFLFMLAILKRRFNITKTWVITGALIWGGLYTTSTAPFYTGFLIDFLLGLFLIYFFHKNDVLSSLVLLTALFAIESCATLFFNPNSGIVNSGYLAAGIYLTGIIIAFFSLYTKDRKVDYDAITPAFEKNVTERERLQRELEIARDVQKSFLPRSSPQLEFAEIASICIPAQEVGGDYFDFVKLKEGKIGVIIGDVSGKGTQAAFYMTLAKGFIKAIARSSDSPAEILIKLNELFYENVERGSFISMVYGVFDPNEKKFTMARAGHNPVILKNRLDKGIKNLNPKGMALGLERGVIFSATIEELEIEFADNDLFVFYTDGFTEAMNKKNEEFGEKSFALSVENNSHLSPAEILKNLIEEVKKFIGKKPQHDDMTIVIVKIRE